MPNLIKWTAEDGKNYKDLDQMYNQVLSQFNRYMGHVTANIGGVYEYYKTYDQDGAVYTHTPRDKQERAMAFLDTYLFETPEWLLDHSIFNKIESDGHLERLKSYQERTLNNLLDFGRFARMMENEEMNDDAYTALEMMEDLRSSLFKEIKSGQEISRTRRNLQRVYISRMGELMTEKQSSLPAKYRSYISRSNIDVENSDIRALVRGELLTLLRDLKNGVRRTRDTMTQYHLNDAIERIDLILNPNGK